MDITYQVDHTRFNYRVGAIIIKNNQLLVITNEEVDYFYSIGGRVKINETSIDAIKREVYEETSLKLEPINLLYIHENFFKESVTNEAFHEIALYYLMSNQFDQSDVLVNSHNGRLYKESIKWIPLSELQNINMKPEFLKTEILRLKQVIKHFITL